METVLAEKLQKLKAVIFDLDGVFFSGQVLVHPKDGEMLKSRSFVDGQGISFLRALGIRIAFITGESTGFADRIGEKLNNLPSVKDGSWHRVDVFAGHVGKNKVRAAQEWLDSIGVDFSECAHMGDDVADCALLRSVGFPAAPAQAEEAVKKIAIWHSARDGGKGAVRDFCDALLEARGIDPESLAIQ